MADESISELEKLAALIGKTNMGWNSIHFYFFLMFHRLSGMSPEAAFATLNAIKSDAGQRNVVVALATHVLTHETLDRSDEGLASNKRLLEWLKKTVAATTHFSGDRNAATHTLWARYSDGTIRPHGALPKNKRLKEDHIKEFKDLQGHYFFLHRELEGVLGDLWHVPLHGKETRQALELAAMLRVVGLRDDQAAKQPPPQSSQA